MMSKRIRLFFHVLLSTVAFAVSGSAQQTSTSPEVISQFEDELDDPRKTLSEHAFEVDAIIRCRIESSEVKTIRTKVPPSVPRKYGYEVFTEHVVTVLEILKSDERLSPEGGKLKIAQLVGEALVDGIIFKRETPFQAFAKGEEYVLFLTVEEPIGLFCVRASDSFRVKDGKVFSQGAAGFAKREQGAEASDLLSRLRGTPPARPPKP